MCVLLLWCLFRKQLAHIFLNILLFGFKQSAWAPSLYYLELCIINNTFIYSSFFPFSFSLFFFPPSKYSFFYLFFLKAFPSLSLVSSFRVFLFLPFLITYLRWAPCAGPVCASVLCQDCCPGPPEGLCSVSSFCSPFSTFTDHLKTNRVMSLACLNPMVSQSGSECLTPHAALGQWLWSISGRSGLVLPLLRLLEPNCYPAQCKPLHMVD